MRCLLAALSLATVAIVALPHPGHSWGDKFLVPGRGPNLASIHRPPKALAILIYGNASSTAMSAVAGEDFKKTLTTVGHRIHHCDGATACSKAVAEGHYDVVLADAADAASLKAAPAKVAVIPVLIKPSKDDMAKAKSEYGQAFDASRGGLRLLSVVNSAAKKRP